MHPKTTLGSARAGGRLSHFAALTNRPLAALLLTAALGGVLLTAVVSSQPAGASARLGAGGGISSLRARAAVIASEIDQDSTEFHLLDLQYGDEVAKAAQLEDQVVQTESEISADDVRVSKARSNLSQVAIAAYVSGGDESDLSMLLSSSTSSAGDAAASQAYLSVSSNQLARDTGALQDAVIELDGTLASEDRARAKVTAEIQDTAKTRQLALAEISGEQSQLDQVQGKMAELVAAAEEQQALLAAKRAAAQRHQPAPVAPVAPVAPQGPPLPVGPPTIGLGGSGPSPSPTLQSDFAKLRMCESGGDYAINTGNGFYGAYQFALATWEGLGYSGLPSAAPPATQDAAAYKLWQQEGWSPWPACSAMLGL